MCRASGEGGRRCPCAGPAYRSAYRKAHRAAGHAATAGTTSPGNVGRPSTPELAELDTLEGRITLARRVSLAAGELTDANQDEWNEARSALVKEHGSVERAATALGAVIAAGSEELAGVTGKQVRDGLAQRQGAMIETFYASEAEIQGVRAQRDAVFTPEFRALEAMRVALRGLEGPERANALAQYEGAHEAHTQRWRQHPLNLRWSELSDQQMAIRTALSTGSDEESKAQLRSLAGLQPLLVAKFQDQGRSDHGHDPFSQPLTTKSLATRNTSESTARYKSLCLEPVIRAHSRIGPSSTTSFLVSAKEQPGQSCHNQDKSSQWHESRPNVPRLSEAEHF